MWFWIIILIFGAILGVSADCDNSISVEGVSDSYGNDIVNGEYLKINNPQCNSRDVFNHTTNAIYLRHYDDGGIGIGIWVFSDVRDCVNSDVTNEYVRAYNEDELNPGLVQIDWQEKIPPGIWENNDEINVDCYEITRCRYRITGATNTSLNVHYDKVEGEHCEFRDVHKHESQDLYLYFIWSSNYNEYYWVVNSAICIDAVYNGAVLQNDDYSVAPELIQNDWQERNNDGGYATNTNIDIDCFEGDEGDPGLSAGAIAGIVIGCVAGVALIAVAGFFIDKSCKKRNKVGGSGRFD